MLIPSSFKDTIADTFYDKTVTMLTKVVTTDSEGGVKKSGTTTVGTFKGNVRFEALGAIQNEIGLTEHIDVAITCDPETELDVDDLLEYAGVKYMAVGVVPYDSHKLIVGRRWQVQ